MTLRRLHVPVTCLLLLLAAPGRALLGQESPAAPSSSAVQRQSETTRIRFGSPIFRFGEDYRLPAGEVVREVTTVFGDATIEGTVDSDVQVIMGSARLASTAIIERSLVVIGGRVTIEEGAIVRRDLVVVGGRVTAPPGFAPRGEHVIIGGIPLGDSLQGLLPWATRGLLLGRLIVPDLDWVWVIVGIFFLLYLALNLVFDGPVAASADALVERPLSAFLVGFLVLLLTVPALAIVAASVVGLALVPFLLCALVILALVGKTAVVRAIGRGVTGSRTPEGRFRAFAAFLIGFALLTLAYMVPILGFVTWALTSVLGLGAATVTFRTYVRRERQVPAPARPEPAVAPVSPPAVALIQEREPVSGDAPPPAARDAHVPATEPPPPPPPPPPPAPPPPPLFSAGLAQYPRATFFDRVAAFALDAILVAIANAFLDLGRHDGAYFLLLLGYHIAFWAWKGTTLGGIICNLRVIRTHGTELRFVDALVRGLSSVFSIAALGIGCLWMLQDPERQMWHDKIAGTLVVKVPRDLVLP